jgi:hypothetical protein
VPTRTIPKRWLFDQFAGLSDKAVPLLQSRIESQDLRNVDFFERVISPRNGMQRMHTNMLRDCSVRLDGRDDYITIAHQTAYNVSSKLFLSIDVVLREWKAGSQYVVHRGDGTAAGTFIEISYDSTINTNAGGWRCRAYDANATTLRNVTINDGNGGSTPINFFRQLEVLLSSGTTYTFRALDDAGAVVATTTFTLGTWVTSTQPYIIGALSSASGYCNGTFAEFRIADAAAAPSFAGVVSRELTPTEILSCEGYWKLNDGNGNTVNDYTSTGNDGIAGGEGAKWVTDSTRTVGGSGLQFFGDTGHVYWQFGGISSLIFSNASTGQRTWGFGGLFVPLMAAGETTVRDQTLLWFGTDAASPQPLGIRVVSDNLVGYYRDGTSLKSVTLSTLALSSVVGTRIRIFAGVGANQVGVERFNFQCHVEGGSSYASDVATAGNEPSTISADASIARKITSFTYPHTTSGSSAYCVLDDFVFWKTYGSTAQAPMVTVPAALRFRELAFYEYGTANSQRVASLPMNDGYGQQMTVSGALTTTAALYPEEETGIRWDIGLVDPYESVKGVDLTDFVQLTPDSAPIRQHLAISGTTLYALRPGETTADPVAGNMHKGGPWVDAQYGAVRYFACANGKRPRKWNGSSLDWVGIRPPYHAPFAAAATSGGSLADGTYGVYVTFRNPDTASESMPSVVGIVTISGGGGSGKIDSVQLPVSSDPQVKQRRIYVTAINDSAGDAYLMATVDDNTTINYTTDITTVTTSNLLLVKTGREPPPPGPIIAVWKDRLFVAGDPLYPTRLYYSAVGALDEFDTSTDYEDVDLDSGDPITALEIMRDTLVAHLGDGRVALTATGNDAQPFLLQYLDRDKGAVGPKAVAEFESTQVYATERDFFLWDGVNSFNISSPNDPNRPSIQTFVRNQIEPSLRRDIQLATHRTKQQFWFALAKDGSTRNDAVLVFTFDVGTWSLYDMDVDVLAELEDENDEPWLYGISRGFICKLDTGDADGSVASFATRSGTATSGTTTTLVDSTKSWTTNQFKGTYAYWWDASAEVRRKALIASNTATTLTFYDATTAPADDDTYVIAGIPWWIDFNLNGDVFSMKRLQWLMLRGESDASNRVRASLEPNLATRDMPFSNAQNYDISWASTETFKRAFIGGAARNWRLRLGDSGLTSIGEELTLPSRTGKVKIHEFAVEYLETMAK